MKEILFDLMDKCLQMHASDIHLTVGLPPVIRVNGRLQRIGEVPLEPGDIWECITELLEEIKIQELEKNGQIDTAISASGRFRYRVNIFRQRGTYAVAMRNVDSSILSLEQLGLPSAVKEFTKMSHGLVLVTGPTGSGKSTTLAAMVDIINRTRDCHILTLEDPVEFLHKHERSIVNQREIGTDTADYHAALRSALREDPDVILIGEMRDHESMVIALTAAETGHLVLSTLHTIGAAKTIDRIIDVFPPSQQQQIRIQLSTALQGVISQQLIPNTEGNKRELAVEIMFANTAIRNMIRESKTHQINNTISSGRSAGMITMDDSLIDLFKQQKISYADVILHSMDPEYIRQFTGRQR